MYRTIESALLFSACLLLSSCAIADRTAGTLGAAMADMPPWLGGLPAGVPPRPGTPEYDAWQAERAQEAARLKNNQPK
jgi:hypothetical protein